MCNDFVGTAAGFSTEFRLNIFHHVSEKVSNPVLLNGKNRRQLGFERQLKNSTECIFKTSKNVSFKEQPLRKKNFGSSNFILQAVLLKAKHPFSKIVENKISEFSLDDEENIRQGML